MYDYDKCVSAFKKFILEFDPDMHIGASAPGPGRFYELLDYKLYAWPGHGVAPEHCYQCIEKEYMTADEYDLLLMDPSFFFRNFYHASTGRCGPPYCHLPAPKCRVAFISSFGLPRSRKHTRSSLKQGLKPKMGGRHGRPDAS